MIEDEYNLVLNFKETNQRVIYLNFRKGLFREEKRGTKISENQLGFMFKITPNSIEAQGTCFHPKCQDNLSIPSLNHVGL